MFLLLKSYFKSLKTSFVGVAKKEGEKIMSTTNDRTTQQQQQQGQLNEDLKEEQGGTEQGGTEQG